MAQQPHEKNQITRLKKLFELSLTLSGDPMEIFQHAAKMIGELLEVKIVCLSEIQGEQLNFLAVYKDGEVYINAGSCLLANTPCATVEQEKNIQIYDRVKERFPEAIFLQDHNAFAYCGFPSLDNFGEVVAVTCLLDDKAHDFTNEDQEVLRIIGQRIGMEIERKHNLEAKERISDILRINEDRLYQATRVSGTGIFEQNHCIHSIYCSPELRKHLGWDADEIVTAQTFADSIYHEDRERVIDAIKNAQQPYGNGLLDIEHRILRRDGEVQWLATRSQTFFASDGKDLRAVRTVGAVCSITARKTAEEKIKQLAFYDPLTNLPNRTLLIERLEQAIATHSHNRNNGALLFLDLDNFKMLNDTQGHRIGDELLIEVGKRLKNCVNEAATVSRLGGDEFVVLLEELSENVTNATLYAGNVAEKIINSLSKPYQLSSLLHYISASIGIALFNSPGTTTTSVLVSADTAMYQAKKSGKNTYYFFDPLMQQALEQRSQLENALHGAIANNELRLFYQPLVDDRGQIISVEALIRWLHPKQGMIAPLQFIPLAEETGLILSIGHWVLETACTQLEAWKDGIETQKLSIAVNISAKHFYQTKFVDSIRNLIAQYTIQPLLLKLELTESMVLENIDLAIEKMQELKALGIVLSMDDFGTGYSSLNYLKQLPFDQIKIDKCFVNGIIDAPNDAFIVDTVIALGQRLGMNVVAEGVENAKQWKLLQRLGCGTFQGYYFCKPVPAYELALIIHKQKKYPPTLLDSTDVSRRAAGLYN